MKYYFAAANTEKGFVSWFDDIFDPKKLDRAYIIKGGSGTGKSTLIKKAAARAEKKGAECEGFFCSSDPSSLDGVIMTMPNGRRLAMIDGTAPHTRDPKYPGVCDEIVNLGEYWCADLLTRERETVISLCTKKAKLYADAYADFAAAGSLTRQMLLEAKEYLLEEKLYAAVSRLLAARIREFRIKPTGTKVNIRGLSALSCGGEVKLTGFDDSERVCLAVDLAGVQPFLFDALIKAARELSLSYDRAPCPLIPELTEAIRFPELSLSVVSTTERNDVKPINMSRFVDRDKLADCDRARRRTLKRSAAELVESGLEKLSRVKRLHGELEAIYIRAMDFTLLGDAGERLMERMGL